MILTKDISFMEERECDALEEDEGAAISIINMASSEYGKSSESFRNRPAMKGRSRKRSFSAAASSEAHSVQMRVASACESPCLCMSHL